MFSTGNGNQRKGNEERDSRIPFLIFLRKVSLLHHCPVEIDALDVDVVMDV